MPPRKRGGEIKATVAHRSADQRHRRRTQSVLTRRPPHPARLTGALKQKLPTLIWLKGKQKFWYVWAAWVAENADNVAGGEKNQVRGKKGEGDYFIAFFLAFYKRHTILLFSLGYSSFVQSFAPIVVGFGRGAHLMILWVVNLGLELG
jgi:hypothetical protein